MTRAKFIKREIVEVTLRFTLDQTGSTMEVLEVKPKPSKKMIDVLEEDYNIYSECLPKED